MKGGMIMNAYRYTKVWNINGQLVVADTVEKALQVYNSSYEIDGYLPDIKEITAVSNGKAVGKSYDALISNENHPETAPYNQITRKQL